MRKHGRRDANQAEIVTALRRLGCGVIDMADLGDGYPDLAVGKADSAGIPRNYFLEVKTDTGKLTDDEKVFFADWPGHVRLVRSVEDALKAVGAL